MKVVLLKSVPKVGKKDDVVDVASGYAQHALFPKKLAVPATDAALGALRTRMQNTAAEKAVRHNLLDKAITELKGMKVTIPVKANAQGNLFSKIHEADIAAHIYDTHRIAIDASLLQLVHGPIKTLGKHAVHVADGEFAADFVVELTAQ